MTTESRRILILVLVCGLIPPVVQAADETKIEIEPGPRAMTDEERSLDGDPGLEDVNGVILVEETDRDQSFNYSDIVTYHLRAKILTAEGRDLADVEIPFNSESSRLKRWWGFTVLPDGTVLELPEEDLDEQVVIRSGWSDYSVLKGTLPGVVPGSVIDFGYTVKVREFVRPRPIALQRDWPMRLFRYRWVPWIDLTAAYAVMQEDQVSVNVTPSGKAILVEARDCSPLRLEPMGPPESALRATLHLYYSDARGSVDTYWDERGEALEKITQRFVGSSSKQKKLLREIDPLPEGDLESRLHALYDWLTATIENTSLRTWEAREAAGSDDDEGSPETAKEALADRRGSGWDLDLLFIGLARALGAEAHLVIVPDRTDWYWQPAIYSLDQFDGMLVGIGGEGRQLRFADPGSGLPFGQIPWWFSAVPAGMAGEDGLRQVMTPIPMPEDNVETTTVEMSFDEIDGTLLVDWSQSGSGQARYAEKLRLRTRSPEKREDRLLELCGESADLEVLEATAPELDDIAASFRLECSCEQLGRGPVDGEDVARIDLDGPWIEALPELTDETRTQAVILPYPHVDTTTYSITAPVGFAPDDPPEPISLSHPFARYTLRVAATPEGYEVSRMLVLAFVKIDPPDYPELLEFLNAVRSADRTSLTFSRVDPA